MNTAVRENVYINHNLTKIEARLAYEEKCRRRQRRRRQRLSQTIEGDVQPSLRVSAPVSQQSESAASPVPTRW